MPCPVRALAIVALAAAALAASLPAAAQDDFRRDIEPLLAEFCYDCHGDGVDKGDLTLDGATSADHILEDRANWETVLYNVENWVMPPPDKKRQPTEAERTRIAQFLESLLYPVDCDNPDPGRTTIRRLNRAEYNNTMRDLIGLDLRPADDFPADDAGYGFDTIGDVLSLPPILMERYLMAADALLDAAIVAGPPEAEKFTFGASTLRGGTFTEAKGRHLTSEGAVTFEHRFPAEGDYRLRIQASADRAGDELPKMVVSANDQSHPAIEVDATVVPKAYDLRIPVPKGHQTVSVAFVNDFYDAASGADRNLYISAIELEGPFAAKGSELPETHRNIFIADPKELGEDRAAKAIIQRFANRAFRRPAKRAEVERLASFVKLARGRGDTFEMGIKQALRACLVSPHFLFRIEWQPEPDNPQRIHDISDFALASRLSYFLWSTMPDDELLSLAFNDELRPNLAAQVDRMLADPKIAAFAENFAGQWLETRNLLVQKPDADTFPEFTPELRDAMAGETRELFLHILRQNLPVTEFLTADYTFANGPLAEHYGIQGIGGRQFHKVSLQGTNRRGILSHASILTVTSDPARTSPVKRGKWVLDNLLGTPPPPPPPNVPELDGGGDDKLTGTLRQQMEEHRNNPACAGCHSLMDPLGFGLENYDAIGRYREQDAAGPIDPSGKLVSGQEFRGASELTAILATDKHDLFVRCLTKKLLTYALGRGVEWYDKCAVDEITTAAANDGHQFQSLIHALTRSVPFQKRRGDGERYAN
ncbi:DUF1592 domain-containing protein [soil metagenome]